MSTGSGRRVRWWRVLPAGLAGLLARGGVIGAVLGWLPGIAVALVAVAAVGCS